MHMSVCVCVVGSPSGHAMISAAVWYQLAHAASAWLGAYTTGVAARVLVWTVFLLSLICVSVSRLFIATHFPHQVVLGSLAGFILARVIIQRRSLISLSLKAHVLAAVALVCGAFACYGLLLAAKMDPSSSVKLALKHCASRDWVHLDTTPFYSLFRASGTVLGLGMMSFIHVNDVTKLPVGRAAVGALVTLFVVQLYLRLPLVGVTNSILFYVLSCVRFAIFPCIALVSLRRWHNSFIFTE